MEAGVFISDIAICSVKTETDGSLSVTVGNLVKGSGFTQPINYYVMYPGFVLGPAAKSLKIDASLGQNALIECSSYTSTGELIDKLM